MRGRGRVRVGVRVNPNPNPNADPNPTPNQERAKIFGGLRCLGSRDMKAPRRLPPCLAAAPALPAPLVPLLGEG